MTRKGDRSYPTMSVDDAAAVMSITEEQKLHSRSNAVSHNYKAQADESKRQAMTEVIKATISKLQIKNSRPPVDFDSLEDVQLRCLEYLEACQLSKVNPSVLGLSVFGFGVDRHTVSKYINQHNTPSAQYIRLMKDVIADILTSAAEYGYADTTQVIFQLKNLHEFADTVKIQPVSPVADDNENIDADAIRRKYMGGDILKPVSDEGVDNE